MAIMQRAGTPILAGTDAGAPVLSNMPPGFALHAELAMYVAEGLTPLIALQSATLNPATFLHATDTLGTIAPGKLADLVLLDADPLADITNRRRSTRWRRWSLLRPRSARSVIG
jgi:imidazolonepropionase-like amidohydrolase